MGFTRAKRYANRKGGRKYAAGGEGELLPKGTGDPQKETCAQIFRDKWQLAEGDEWYIQRRREWIQQYESPPPGKGPSRGKKG
jgi:hypothetical protein